MTRAFLAALLLAGACSARRSEPIAGPLTLVDGEARRGKTVYAVHCDRCHPGGEGGLGPSINNKPLTRSMIALQVRRGLGAHPPFPKQKLSNDDLHALTEYLKQLRRNGRS